MNVQNNEDAKRLLAAAVGFLEASKAIRGIEGPPVHYPALYTNLYYTIELSLKSYLSSRGMARSVLSKLGHKLGQSLERAQIEGFQVRDSRLAEFIGQVDGKLLELRYLEGSGFETAEPDEAILLVAKLLEDIAHGIPAWSLR